jgi:hypothetical protein
MATINTFQEYCNLHNLKVMDRRAIIMDVGSNELEDDVLVWGVGNTEDGHQLLVAIFKVGGHVEVLKKWANSPVGDDVYALVTDDELMLGIPLHVTV